MCTLSEVPAECWLHPQTPQSSLGRLQALQAACGECIECTLDASDPLCTSGGGGLCVLRKLHMLWNHQIPCPAFSGSWLHPALLLYLPALCNFSFHTHCILPRHLHVLSWDKPTELQVTSCRHFEASPKKPKRYIPIIAIGASTNSTSMPLHLCLPPAPVAAHLHRKSASGKISCILRVFKGWQPILLDQELKRLPSSPREHCGQSGCFAGVLLVHQQTQFLETLMVGWI